MGLFDGRSSSYHETSRHTSRHASPARSGYSSRPSYARSASSLFGGSSRGVGGSSYYKRRPRDGYISYMFHRLQRMIRELWSYARRHPVKAFFAIIVPLLSAGGAIGGLMKQFGVKMPMGMGGRLSRGSGGGGYYGSRGYGEESSAFGGSGPGGSGAGGGWMDNAGSIMKIAQAFM